MKSAFDGTAFTFFILCCSQADNNCGETFSTLCFGKDAHGLKMNIRKPPMLNIAKAIKTVGKEIEELKVEIEKSPNEKTTTRLTNDLVILNERLEVFEAIEKK